MIFLILLLILTVNNNVNGECVIPTDLEISNMNNDDAVFVASIDIFNILPNPSPPYTGFFFYYYYIILFNYFSNYIYNI